MDDPREPESMVLLVEADPDERERFGTWLEDEGFQVITCSGPTEPDYTCIGARAGACPLAEAASVVVLDMSTRSEGVAMGTASEELLALYLFVDRRVVALGSHPGGEVPGQLLRRPRHPERDELVSAVRSLAELEPSSRAPTGPPTLRRAHPGANHWPL